MPDLHGPSVLPAPDRRQLRGGVREVHGEESSQVVGFDAAIAEFSSNFQAVESLRIEIKNLVTSEVVAAAELEIVINEVENLRVVDVISFGEDQKILSIVAFKGLQTSL